MPTNRKPGRQQKLGEAVAWLNKPFPFTETAGPKLLISALFGGFIFLFLALFQPFGIQNITGYKYLFLAGFGIITFVVMLINFFVLPAVFPTVFDLDTWVVKKHILFCLLNILLITFTNWLYSFQVAEHIPKYHSLPSFLAITFSIGIIPTVFLSLLIERGLWTKHNEIARDVSIHLQEQKDKRDTTGSSIELVTDNKKETLQLQQNQLICVNSEGNYSKVYYQDEGRVMERLMRVPLKKVEEQLADFEMIVRCHRSYIVNLNQIQSISGNARSFKLHFAVPDLSIPVSRNFPKSVIDQIKK